MDSSPLMLSISGLRGVIGASLTPEVAARYAGAVGQWFASQQSDPPHVVVGRDSRTSGPMIESAVCAGLLGAGCRVTRLGIVCTPGVAVMAQHLGASGGVVITASHNPTIWNGIKTLDRTGCAPPPEEANKIISAYSNDRIAWVPVQRVGQPRSDDTANRVHADRVLGHLDVPAIRRRRVKVVLDSVHGAGGIAGRLMLEALGVELVHLYGEPTGQFPHEPEPTKQNLVELGEQVKRHAADVGFAQDPDADRLAVVDEKGRYIGEEYTLALAALHVLSRTPGPAAANLSTSRMLDDIAGKFGCPVHRTAVGEANVAARMRQERAVIGGEGNGGVIWPPVVHVRDSLAGMGLILELLASTGKTLSQLTADFPSYAIVKDKLDIAPGIKDKILPTLSKLDPSARVDTQDGVRLDWPDRWVHVRPSNTEPILRLIAEAREEAQARDAIARVRSALGLDR